MRPRFFVLSSWALAFVLTLTTLVGGAAAGSATSRASQGGLVPAVVTTGQLCVQKFNDLNGNGTPDPGEPFLSGWVFTIKVATTVLATVTTGQNGTVCIDLPPGPYTVTETLQAGWTPTTPGGLTQPAIVVAGAITNVTFGNHQSEPGRLCVQKFNDLNGNGRPDPGEPFLAGWVFTIRDAAGNVVATVTTGVGDPVCILLPPGTYTVTETPQAGWTPTTPGGVTQTVTVVAGQTINVIFGNHQTELGRLCVVKFNDLNGNGKQDPGEPLLTGWVFTIRDAAGNVVATVTTGQNGVVCVLLPPGTYTVTETLQNGWTPTTQVGLSQTAIVVAGQTTNVIFGNHQTELGPLCVVKFNDLNGNGKQDPGEPLLTGWVFTVKDAAGNVVATLVSGTHSNCVDLKPGTYTVTETLQNGWTPTTAGGVTQTVTVVAGQTINVIFGNKRCCLTFTFLGGKIDNFSLANGATAEPVTPVIPALSPPTAAYFDATASNVRFGHRFYLGAGNCIESATLEIKIKALPGGSTNDTMLIKVPGGPSWLKSISAIPPLIGPWTPPKVKTILLNLGAMVPSGPSTLIPALNSIRILDIIVQDDTKVDYIKLVVVFCECVHPSTPAPILPGYDLFETDPATTSFQFHGPAAIPPGFFDPGSDPFQGTVNFGGVPLGTFGGENVGDADTVVRRDAVAIPGATIPIELVALNLVSVEPITVTYNGGQRTELWNVNASPSPQLRSVGHIAIHQGGTFDSQLLVVPRLTFIRLSDGAQRALDGAGFPEQALAGLTLNQTGGPWRAGCILPALAVPGLNDGFCPGLTPNGKKQLTGEIGLLAAHGVYPAQPALEHFKCYSLQPKDFASRQVQLTDQFGSRNANVTKRAELCNPVQKNEEPFKNQAAHLQCYVTSGPDEQTLVAVQNQFGSQLLLVHRATRLCLPTQKRLIGGSFQQIRVPIDHYQCYDVEAKTALRALGQPGALRLTDQFGSETVTLGKPFQLCAPVQKTLAGHTTPIQHPVKHLVCYRINDTPVHRTVEIRNQFGTQTLDTQASVGLCVPSNKLVLP